MEEQRWFITVDWCNQGRRGVFCNSRGTGYSKETEHSNLEMQDILGPFWMILAPLSVQLTAEELAKYKFWLPLAEYSGEFGVARVDEEMSDDST